MSWSTHQLATLAGTTSKTLRHYHRVGLLPEPRRLSNGYRQYEVTHLVRLLHVIRLAELGMPLATIASLDRTTEREALQSLQIEHAASAARLDGLRAELSSILQEHALADAHHLQSPRCASLSETDRSLLTVWARLFDQAAIDDLAAMVDQTSPEEAFDALTSEADRATRRGLGRRMAPTIRHVLDEYPSLRDQRAHARQATVPVPDAVVDAVRTLYNPAQLEVITRASLIALEATDELDAFEAYLDQLPEGSDLALEWPASR